MELAHYALPDLASTGAFASRLAEVLKPGDVLYLRGDLGAGKTALARALIQKLAGEELVVNSPTFTLMQPHDISLQGAKATCWHIDLYRIEESGDIEELGLWDIQPGALLVIEWPERLEEGYFPDAITCHLDVAPDGNGRMVTLSCVGTQAQRLSQVVHVSG